MLDVASNLPSDTQLDGLDINLSQVPPKEWLPPNMSFHIYDFNQETPANMVEHYDVVHVRHLFTIIKHDDPTSVLQSLLRLLS